MYIYIYIYVSIHMYIHMYIHTYIHMKCKNLKRKSAKSFPQRH